MRCLSGDTCFVMANSCRASCTRSADKRTESKQSWTLGSAAWGYVGEVILCDVSGMALLSHIPRPIDASVWRVEM
jgi:hypothetical protein